MPECKPRFRWPSHVEMQVSQRSQRPNKKRYLVGFEPRISGTLVSPKAPPPFPPLPWCLPSPVIFIMMTFRANQVEYMVENSKWACLREMSVRLRHAWTSVCHPLREFEKAYFTRSRVWIFSVGCCEWAFSLRWRSCRISESSLTEGSVNY